MTFVSLFILAAVVLMQVIAIAIIFAGSSDKIYSLSDLIRDSFTGNPMSK